MIPRSTNGRKSAPVNGSDVGRALVEAVSGSGGECPGVDPGAAVPGAAAVGATATACVSGNSTVPGGVPLVVSGALVPPCPGSSVVVVVVEDGGGRGVGFVRGRRSAAVRPLGGGGVRGRTVVDGVLPSALGHPRGPHVGVGLDDPAEVRRVGQRQGSRRPVDRGDVDGQLRLVEEELPLTVRLGGRACGSGNLQRDLVGRIVEGDDGRGRGARCTPGGAGGHRGHDGHGNGRRDEHPLHDCSLGLGGRFGG